MVLDVDAVTTGCQGLAGEPAPSGCAGSGTHTRWFLRFVDEQVGLEVLASGSRAGCANVDEEILELPRALCEGLAGR